MVIKTARDFEKEFKKLPGDLREVAKKKLALLIDNQAHPSLRVKKVQGYHEEPPIMEMSVTMAVRITFQQFSDFLYLRHVGKQVSDTDSTLRNQRESEFRTGVFGFRTPPPS
ncbi:MAG: hypothetical protein HY542_07105 [Deltaproteobacteria bacterium]|nr:hypothetical protein [Deltaproteobacteria bacterium]